MRPGHRFVWAGALFLSLVGVTAALFRATHVTDAAVRAEPVRQLMLRTVGVADPDPARRAADVRAVDATYAAHPRLILAHVLSGAAFLALAPLQFWARLRNRYRHVHRWSGRVLLGLLILATAPALYFGLGVPFGGSAEATVIGVVALLMLTAATRAYLAIRRGQVAQHRKWMLRLFALALGIATVRVLAPGVDLALTPFGIGTPTAFVVTLWLGWGITAAGAELWIALTSQSR